MNHFKTINFYQPNPLDREVLLNALKACCGNHPVAWTGFKLSLVELGVNVFATYRVESS